MSDELRFFGDPASQSGLSVTGTVYDRAGSKIGTAVGCPEVGSLAIYTGDMPTEATSNGVYIARFEDAASNLLDHQTIYWNGDSEVDVTAIWDQPSQSHSQKGSTGFDLLLAGRVIEDTSVVGVPTSSEIPLGVGSSIDDFYNNELIFLASGPNRGQSRIVADYNGATKTITVSAPFYTAPGVGNRVVLQTTHTYTSDEIKAVAKEAVTPDLTIINDGLKDASKLIPHDTNLT